MYLMVLFGKCIDAFSWLCWHPDCTLQACSINEAADLLILPYLRHLVLEVLLLVASKEIAAKKITGRLVLPYPGLLYSASE
jgi:hypothetical protein